MTICLAASCWSDNVIVTVSDRRLSYSDVVEATDSATRKNFQLSKGWGIMFSADDVSPVSNLIAGARARLQAACKVPPLTFLKVRAAVCESYCAATHERVVAEYLARYGFGSVENFLAVGLSTFGPDEFARINSKIEKFDLGVSLLVYGFDENPAAGGHVFEIRNPGVIVDHDLENFGIIGSGSWQALASLTVRGGFGLGKVNECIYRLCEAKFNAETASGVGKATTVAVLGANGRTRQLPPDDIEKLREVWNAARNKPIPIEVAAIIGDQFKKLVNSDNDN